MDDQKSTRNTPKPPQMGYELDQAQKFLARVGKNFLDAKIPQKECFDIADCDFEFDDEKVIEYGQRYNDDKLDQILEIMPGAVQLPVNQKCIP
ncbi:7779_t:CDS:2, partial [Scutellospora calospora]